MVRRTSPSLFLTICLCLLPGLAGGAGAQEWYQFYEKGMEAMRAKRAPLAIGCFERAIRKQPTPGEDLLTFGNNRLLKYYPYLRLAEASAMAGDFSRARRALKRSEAVGIEPSAERALVAKLLGPSDSEADSPASRPRFKPPFGARSGTPDPTRSGFPVATATLPEGRPEGSGRPNGMPSPASATAVAAQTPSPRLNSSPEGRNDPRSSGETGVVEITTTPGGADVYLDGEFIGRSDDAGKLLKRDVPIGVHELRAGGVSGFMERRESVKTGALSQASMVLDRQAERAEVKPAPSSSPWLILGAALGLGAIGAFVLKSKRTGQVEAAPTTKLAETGLIRGSGANPVSKPPTFSATLGRPETTSTPMAPTDASRFGEYQLIEQLGKGGMASVYRARREGEDVALKRPLPAFLSETELLERFGREAEIGRTLNHPNIIRIFDKGRVDQVPYFTMELVDGETLHSMARREGALPPVVACNIVKQVAEALDYSHMKGVIHRDLKPSNIMLLRSGVVKVMDYGIARSSRFDGLTVTGAFMGTPEYIAPETAEGGKTDARSDLYSVGVIFYEVLTGVRPFVGDTPFATLKKICSEPPTPPSAVRNCPDELEAIVLRLLKKNPNDRHASAEELLNDINDYLNKPAQRG